MTEQLKSIDEFERRQKLFQDYITSDSYQDKLVKRIKVNDACERNIKESRIAMWQAFKNEANPAQGCITFIETFGYTFDPRPQATLTHIPFFLFDYQKQAVKWMVDLIDTGQDGLVEKSRDMGMSWLLFVWVPLWYWLFRDGINILMGSYKEALVDDRTIDSLFGKIDYAVLSLPDWILPKNFDMGKCRRHMKLHNPDNHNEITGDTMNPNFGRGSRKTAILFDELGFWDYAKDGWEASGDSTACRIANSTPNGYNFFAMLRETGISRKTFHWKEHPLKDEQWYEFEKSRKTDEAVAQELDISYSKSLEGRVYPEWNDDNVEMGTVEYDPNLPLYVGWDFGRTDDTGIIWSQPYRGELRIIDTYRNTGKTIDFYVPFITGITPSDGYKYTKKDLEKIAEHRHWKRGTHFGDPAGRFRNQVSDETVISILRKHGIHMNYRDQWKEFEKRRSAAKLLIRDGIQLHENKETKYFNVCMLNAAYPQVKNQGVKQVRSVKPKHDYTSHYRSAFEYLALGLSEIVGNRREAHDSINRDERAARDKRSVVGY